MDSSPIRPDRRGTGDASAELSQTRSMGAPATAHKTGSVPDGTATNHSLKHRADASAGGDRYTATIVRGSVIWGSGTW